MILTVRLTEKEMEYLKKKAVRDIRTVSGVIRLMIKESIDGTQSSEQVRREVQE